MVVLAAGNAHAAKAAYGLLAWPAATPDEPQAVHRHRIGQVLTAPGTCLLLEGTTEVRSLMPASPANGAPAQGRWGRAKL